ncbi:MAG: tetratricopeptide repeat protein [Lysobacteraceae bacterium]|nr:MAG: tetratricopeptide repeat protein [Xanthomonadaceae bacterium]
MQDKIIDALRRNALDEALEQAREWAQLQPGDPQAHRWLAVAAQQRGDQDGAMRSIDQAIALAPEDDNLQLVRASLLIANRQPEAAEAALGAASGLNPNQFGAYLMQAQLAFGRGDLDEAERLNRLAARVAPEHPQLAVIDGMLALQRGDVEAALGQVTRALQQAPEDAQLRYVLGFIYMRKRHWAFAEQAFRGVLERIPAATGLRGLISDLVNRQDRPAEAADELAPLLQDPATATPAVHRAAGLLRTAARQPEQALPLLRTALASMPADRPTLQALVSVWRELGLDDDARASLDAALATTPDASDLWRARLLFAADESAGREILQRWAAAMPQSTLPAEILLARQQAAGDQAAADATAAQLLHLQDTHAGARLHVLDGLMAQDPAQAVARIEAWLLTATAASDRRFLLGLLGVSHDQRGDSAAAVAAWTRMQAEVAPQRAPLPPLSGPRMEWPELAERPPHARRVAFLWGAPGSAVERLAAVMESLGDPFRSDRFGPSPPQDGFQSYELIEGLDSGRLSGRDVVERWRAALPSRDLPGGDVFDWLPWWDNALLVALRPHLREAMLLIAVRDPRDMLLDWLAFGSAAPFAFPSPEQAAEWMANSLNQAAALFEYQWFPNRVIHTDSIGSDPQAAAAVLGEALEAELPAPASVGPGHFPAGHWRHYSQALAGAFAVLAPVARRLGYPES